MDAGVRDTEFDLARVDGVGCSNVAAKAQANSVVRIDTAVCGTGSGVHSTRGTWPDGIEQGKTISSLQ